MTHSGLFLIGDIPGFTPQIARLVSMMNYTRSATLQAVAGLGVDELDYLQDPQSNSIGTLLSHIAGAEVGYQAATFDLRDLNAEERQPWGAALELGERARQEIRGYGLDHYLGRLEQVRGRWLRSRAMKRPSGDPAASRAVAPLSCAIMSPRRAAQRESLDGPVPNWRQ